MSISERLSMVKAKVALTLKSTLASYVEKSVNLSWSQKDHCYHQRKLQTVSSSFFLQPLPKIFIFCNTYKINDWLKID